jgi:hypothetical protein
MMLLPKGILPNDVSGLKRGGFDFFKPGFGLKQNLGKGSD